MVRVKRNRIEEGKRSESSSESRMGKKGSTKKKASPSSSPVTLRCLKRKKDLKRFEETEECFILDLNPSELRELFKLSLPDNNNNTAAGGGGGGGGGSHSRHHRDVDADLSVVAEKGPVACRDYPHSRHLCLKFPYSTTPHKRHCDMCYCYVCDSAAPCKYWTEPLAPHCDANSSGDYWKERRIMKKKGGNSTKTQWIPAKNAYGGFTY